ncbi:MltF family protein [Microbulbifer hainanensis]|uniref:transporter substrate-binding domain-containing protein n=1 Tax=Microbulbifer hainanensis TaxID=2735675 RepID=UPI001865C57C|nr:transporter substrate-binding domain-containing protein [Microbulbifer hainanensis]
MLRRNTWLAVCIFGLVAATVYGCGKENSSADVSTANHLRSNSVEGRGHERPVFVNYQESGDLDALKKRGVIRFVTYAYSLDDQLPRAAIVTQRHRELADEFARRIGLRAVWIQAKTPAHAVELLRLGQADVLPDNFTDTPQRRELIDVTEPLFHSHQVLVTSRGGPDISAPEKLRNITLLAISQSTFMDTARKLVADYPHANLTVKEINLRDSPDRLIDMLNKYPNSASILDSNIVEGIRQYRNDIRQGAEVSGEENIVWAIRKNSPKLHLRLNNFLTRTLVVESGRRRSDWSAIKKSRVLRLLTHNTATSYFLWKGILMGFDYDLAKIFAEKHGLQLQVIVVPYTEDLIQWLKEGRGDIAGSSTTITKERINQGVVFSTPYLEMPAQVLSNKSRPPIETLQDLGGRTLTVRFSSSFVEVGQILRDHGIDVKIEVAPVSFGQLVNMVADGEIDATVGDAHAVEIESSLRSELLPGILLTEPRPQGWMALPQNKELLQKIDEFLLGFLKTDEYQRKIAAYFKPSGRYTQRVEARIVAGKDLSPYDVLVKNSAEKHEFDWRLVVAQMWQESNFNPKAVSPVGAQGLLQVMPRTAEDMGIPPPLFEPDRGIQAGVKYLDWVRSRFDPNLALDDRLWFSLASYNAGYGHLLDAQRLAQQLGLNPNVWFNNVEKAMLKLSEPRYFNEARYGYVRGAEPVLYVRNISRLYKAYTDVASGEIGRIQEWPGVPISRPRAVAESCQFSCRTTPACLAHSQTITGKWSRPPVLVCRSQSVTRGSCPEHWLSPPYSPLPVHAVPGP